MKFIKLILVLLIITSQVYAQKNHFIYLQTENRQPFYVRSGERILSSSANGYVVIPKLQEGKYDLYVGFPRNEWPRQKIPVKVSGDAGYLLKNFGAKGWGLYNMQTMEIFMAEAGQANADANTVNQADGFANVLADVVNNPSIKQKKEIKEIQAPANNQEQKAVPAEEKKPVQPVEVKKEVLPVDEKKTIQPVQELKTATPENKPAKLIASQLDNIGRTMVYTDEYRGNTDTIRIFIPYSELGTTGKQSEQVNQDIKNAEPQKQRDTVSLEKEKGVTIEKEEKKEVDVPVKEKDSGTVVLGNIDQHVNKADTGNEKPATEPALSINAVCKETATIDDFMKLRKKMASQKTDENMIITAKKVFVTRCFSTEQVGNLSVLFLSDAGRYGFFDAAYPYISDAAQFGSLISKLSEEYYINRFRAMIRK